MVRFGPVLLAMVLFCAFLLFPISDLAAFTSERNLTRVAAASDVNRFKNVFLQESAFEKNNYLTFVGSSTIGIFSRFHPANYFPQKELVPYLEGQPGCTGIIHALDFAALSGSLTHKKLVYMLDPADFMNPNGISDAGFSKYFSDYSGYRFLFNSQITEDLKKKTAVRLLKYSAVKQDPLLVTMLEGLAYDDFQHRLKATIEKPVAFLRMKMLEKQDFVDSFQVVEKAKPFKQQPVPRNLSWGQLDNLAIKEAEAQTSNNHYGFINDSYSKTIQPKYTSYENSWKPGQYLNSVEYDDLRMVLEILHSEQADPVFVLLPRKGTWSDYIGFTKPYRDELYAKIRNEVSSYGFSVIDYSSHEYDKYFMRDPNHLGWTGWVALDHDLLQYDHGN